MSQAGKRTAQQVGRGSRVKGANYERLIAKRWAESGLFPNARRGIGQARSSSEVPDVDGTPFWVECKNRKVHGPLAQYMDQAKAATDGRPPVVICHRLGTSTDTDTVTMLGSEFFTLAIGLGLPAVANILVTISLLDFESLCKGTR